MGKCSRLVEKGKDGRIRAAVALVLLQCLFLQSAKAQNLVANANFDTDLSSWDLLWGSPEWHAADGSNSVSSGSLRADAIGSFGLVTAEQCVVLAPHQTSNALLSARMMRRATTANAAVVADLFESSDCSGVQTASPTLLLGPATVLAWAFRESGEFQVPSSVLSVRIRLYTETSVDSSVQDFVHFDQIQFRFLGADLEFTGSVSQTDPLENITVLNEQIDLDLEMENRTIPDATNPLGVIGYDPSRFRFDGAAGCVGSVSTVAPNLLRWLPGNLAPGQTATCSARFTAIGSPGTVNFLLDSAHDDSDPNGDNDGMVIPATIQEHTDLTLEMELIPRTVTAGTTMETEVTAHNLGPRTASGPKIEVTVGSDITPVSATGCSWTILNPGTIELNYSVLSGFTDKTCLVEWDVDPGAEGEYTFTATIFSSEAAEVDSNPNNHVWTSDLQVVSNVFIVDSATDVPDLDPGDGLCETSIGTCSLRAALMETNAVAGWALIVIGPGGQDSRANRTSGATDEEFGDFDITDDLTIFGFASFFDKARIHGRPGTRGVDPVRVFEIHGSPIVEFENLEISEGNANGGNGGGILQNGGTLRLNFVDLKENHGSSGGAIAAFGTLDLDRVRVFDNTATGGAGLWTASASELWAKDVSIFDNEAASIGGGALIGGLGRLGGSTVSTNEAGDFGGGVYAGTSSDVLLWNSTVALNTAGPAAPTQGLGGGIYVAGSASVSVRSSILEGNEARSGGLSGSCAGTLAELKQSVVFPAPNGCSVTLSEDVIFASALLEPLSAAPNRTESHALSPGSPALDLSAEPYCFYPGPDGTAILFEDQAGDSAPHDGDRDGVAHCDAGSRELQLIFADGFESGNVAAWQ